MMWDEDRGNTILVGLLAFVLVMAFIGWAKFVDAKKDVELWQTSYSDAMDDWRVAAEARDYLDWNLTDVVQERNILKADLLFCQNALDNVPAYCSAGLYEVTIDGLEARVNYLEGQLTSCTNAYTRDFWGEVVSCGWDMCLCNDGFEGCPIYVLEYYADQAMCRTDSNCKNCMYQMIDNGGGLDHDEILWCLEYAYYP